MPPSSAPGSVTRGPGAAPVGGKRSQVCLPFMPLVVSADRAHVEKR